MNGMTEEEKPFRVLSLDGGGMRGLYSATVLQQMAARFGAYRDIGKGFDLIVGTSTGGILASALAAGIPIESIVQMYVGEGKHIFPDPMPDKSSDQFAFWRWVARNIRKPASKADHLKSVLMKIFGGETLGQLYRRRKIALCLTSVDLVRESARVFKTGHIPLKDMDDGLSLVEVCLATSAAPVFFPLAFVGDMIPKPYVDGGLWANNPILIALIEALELAQNRPIEIISIGTCPPGAGSSVTAQELNRGLADWDFNTKTLSVSMNAQASGANHAATFLSRHLSRSGRTVRVIRLPQSQPSPDHTKYLKLDQSQDKAITTFRSLGEADATTAFQMCQDAANADGQTIFRIFQEMPLLKEDKACSIALKK